MFCNLLLQIILIPQHENYSISTTQNKPSMDSACLSALLSMSSLLTRVKSAMITTAHKCFGDV